MACGALCFKQSSNSLQNGRLFVAFFGVLRGQRRTVLLYAPLAPSGEALDKVIYDFHGDGVPLLFHKGPQLIGVTWAVLVYA